MPVYLDHAATSPLRPEALESMLPWMTDRYGNPSGGHSAARRARAAVDDARDLIAEMIGFEPAGVIFTSGGTESDNLAIGGTRPARVAAVSSGPTGGGAVVVGAAEHHAVLHAARAHADDVRTVPLDSDGLLDLDRLASVLDPAVSTVSVMLVNNEIGTIQPLREAAALVRRRAPDAVLHTDAVQAASWMDLVSAAEPADLVSLSAHKFGGPQGVGVLAARKGVAVAALVHGGGQEREIRSGTHNVAGIVGMAAALAATKRDLTPDCDRVAERRDRLADGLLATVPDCSETGARARKVAGNCHVRFGGVEAEALLMLLDDAGICASAGSSCASGALEPSHVLVAMGLSGPEARSSLRLSLGPSTSDADVDVALRVIPAAVARLRES